MSFELLLRHAQCQKIVLNRPPAPKLPPPEEDVSDDYPKYGSCYVCGFSGYLDDGWRDDPSLPCDVCGIERFHCSLACYFEDVRNPRCFFCKDN